MTWKELFLGLPAAPPPDTRPPSVDPAVFATIAKAPVFNPSDGEQVSFAEYRVDAIAREFEQRRVEGREPHPHEKRMVAEAMCYAWMLVGAEKWTAEHVVALEKRMLGR